MGDVKLRVLGRSIWIELFIRGKMMGLESVKFLNHCDDRECRETRTVESKGMGHSFL